MTKSKLIDLSIFGYGVVIYALLHGLIIAPASERKCDVYHSNAPLELKCEQY